MTQTAFFTRLKNRALLKISGQDAKKFLQGLITNDIDLLERVPCLYACILTPQGKFLYDFFIYKNEDGYAVDCEGGQRAQDLSKLLTMYRLRADVDINVTETCDVYAVFGAPNIGTPDPRSPKLGTRSFTKPETMEEQPFDEWDRRRIELTIPDGSRDLVPQKSTMDEANMDTLNAISYDKGCYLGQELTARMHYRGLGKKHLQTVKLDALPENAELRSTCGDMGIALVKG